MDNPILLLDGMNLVNRAVYANMSSASSIHNVVVFFRMLKATVRHLRPSAVYMFWDTTSNTSWRKRIFLDYKDRKSEPVDGLKEQIAQTKYLLTSMLAYLNIHQFYKKYMEADDLIYAACRTLRPQKLMIISTDSDYDQIPFQHDHVLIYDYKTKDTRPIPDCDPALMKSLVGDKSDTIPGYNKIGPVNGAKLTKNNLLLAEHCKTHGEDILRRNLALIDLSLCPFLMHNMLYIRKQLTKSLQFDKNKIMDIISQHQINGIGNEISDVFTIFQAFGSSA